MALLALGACGEVREPDAVDEPRDDLEESHASDELDQQAVDELMALPYAGYVEDDDEESAALEGLVAFDRERSSPGYTLLSVFSLGMALLIDHEGEIVHHWRAPEPSRWEHVELLDSGDILTTVMIGRDENSGGTADEDRYGLRMTWAGEVVSTVRSPVHHQMTQDGDGRLVALSAAWRMERLPGWGEQRRKFPLRDNPVAFFDESGEPVRSVSLFDMIAAAPERFPIQVKKDSDLLHTNSIDWTHRPQLADRSPVYGPNCAVISIRHQDRIAVFDLEQEELVWAWGLGELSGPHDVQLLENGRFIVLDNGVAQKRSRVVEVDPLEGSIAWEWQAPEPADFYTRSKGSVQRLPNGNTLIGNADSGEAFEITHGGDVVWRYLSPLRDDKGRRATLHRARRYDTTFIDGLIAQHGARPYEP